MLVWVIYPPDFDPAKKYPALLYCQGGPQSALTQFYSFRWNFQLMAANGYIVVAPNRRGMPGHDLELVQLFDQCLEPFLPIKLHQPLFFRRRSYRPLQPRIG